MPELRAGIYCPTLTFFDPTTEDLDIPTIRTHAVRLASAGLTGLVPNGSNGEAVHLSPAERITIIRETRSALDEAGFKDVSVVAGCSEQSVRGTVGLIEDAKKAGADAVMLLSPSFYRYAMDEKTVESFFLDVADRSALPIIIYNYPGAVAGIDMDSDLLIRLSAHKMIAGTKFTCGNTGKLARVARELNAVTATERGSGYMAYMGMADFLYQGLVVGGSGVIAGGANVTPKTCVRVFELFKQGKLEEAKEAQLILSKGDWVMTKGAIPGTKAALQTFFGYGGSPRLPLRKLSEEDAKVLTDKMQELIEFENSL